MTNLTRLILAHARYGNGSNPRYCSPENPGGINVDGVADALQVELVLSETLFELWPPSPNIQARALMGEAWRLFPARTPERSE